MHFYNNSTETNTRGKGACCFKWNRSWASVNVSMLYLAGATWELDRSRWKAAITFNLPDLKSSLLQASLIVSDEAQCLLSLKPNDLSRAKFKLEIGFSGSWFCLFFPRVLYTFPNQAQAGYRWCWCVMRRALKLPQLPGEGLVMELTMYCPPYILDLILDYLPNCLFISRHWRASLAPGWLNIECE